MLRYDQTPQQHRQPSLFVTHQEALKKINDRLQIGSELQQMCVNNQNEFDRKKADFTRWNDYNVEILKIIFDNDILATEYKLINTVLPVYFNSKSMYEKDQKIIQIIMRKTNKLKSIMERIPLFKILPLNSNEEIRNRDFKGSKKILIVHGKDETAKFEVARVLEKLDLHPIILHEQPNYGRTHIEKLESEDVSFAIILLTPDDDGKEKNETKFKSRARQNVVAELGYFIGKIGRSRVCPLYVDGVEIPSDFLGVAYVPLDTAGSWKFSLVRELKAAGYNVNANKLL